VLWDTYSITELICIHYFWNYLLLPSFHVLSLYHGLFSAKLWSWFKGCNLRMEAMSAHNFWVICKTYFYWSSWFASFQLWGHTTCKFNSNLFWIAFIFSFTSSKCFSILISAATRGVSSSYIILLDHSHIQNQISVGRQNLLPILKYFRRVLNGIRR
jgi:hypothetical protein